MSFSSNVKEELCKLEARARHCQIAELAAIVSFLRKDDAPGELVIRTENVHVAKRSYMLAKKAFNSGFEVKKTELGKGQKHFLYESSAPAGDVELIGKALKISFNGDGSAMGNSVPGMILQQECCRRAFLRGAFISAGSMSDPEKSYHFEIVCGTIQQAEQIQEVLSAFSVTAGVVERKKRRVVYVKEGNDIVDLLNLMGAHNSLMDMENVRILKDMRNMVNRRVNCETANLSKTVDAAARQIEDIDYLAAEGILAGLSPALVQAAGLRREYPDASLSELGEMSEPPVGRSGMNHRLAKLSRLAKEAREGDS